MAEEKFITRIRTNEGDLQIAWAAIGDPPEIDTTLTKSLSPADAKTVGDKMTNIEGRVQTLENGGVSSDITINNKPLTGNITLTASDVGAASAVHEHSANSITDGVLPMKRGGTEGNTGQEGLKNLFGAGYTVLSEYQYGDATPTFLESEKKDMTGAIFFVKVQQ